MIEIQEIGLKKFRTELQRVVGLHQILAGNVIIIVGTSLVPTLFRKGCGHKTSLEPLVNCQCSFTF